MTIEERNDLVLQYKDLADQIASRKKAKCVKKIQLEELKSAAYLGLIDAATKYDKSKGVSFKSYAYYRISGEIQDYLRSCGDLKRSQKKVNIFSIFSQNPPTGESFPFKDGLTLTSKEESVIDTVNKNHLFEKITNCLPPIAKKIMKLYYIEEQTMKKIGKELNICESRVSQIVSDSRSKIKGVWGNHKNELMHEASDKEIHPANSLSAHRYNSRHNHVLFNN